jgi:hypothetical protein
MSLARAALLAVAAAALTASGCHKPEPVAPEIVATDVTAQPAPASQPIVVTRLRPGPHSFTYSSGITEPRRAVIRDEAAWRTAWAEIWARTGPTPPPLPAIDFTRDMVVLAALGQRNSGGYSITVDSASRAAGGIVVWVTKLTPGTCGTLAALTQPVDVVSITRMAGSVEYREREAVSPGCL